MMNEAGKIEAIIGERFLPDNRVHLLYQGKEAFNEIFRHIRGASRSICLEFYIFRNDDTGKRLAEILMEKAESGVRVYLLYDHFGSLGTPCRFWKMLRTSGVNVKPSRPFSLREPSGYIRRDHKKLIIIDGATAFTGGLNIANEYSGFHLLSRKVKTKRSRAFSWRDTGVILSGPVVKKLSEYFAESWKRSASELIKIADAAEEHHEGFPVIPIFASSPRGRRRLRKLLYWSIESSRKNIRLTTAYFTPSPKLSGKLISASKRGVNVELLLPFKSDILAAHYAARSFFTSLLRENIRIYLYQGSILHAKTYIFDDEWSIIGSANLDFRSLRKNDEGNVGILSREFGDQMKKLFIHDKERSIPVNMEDWLKRPLCSKAAEKFFALFRRKL